MPRELYKRFSAAELLIKNPVPAMPEQGFSIYNVYAFTSSQTVHG